MKLVANDRTPEGGADLLIRVRKDAPGDGIGRVEPVVAEIAVKAARWLVGARTRDGLHLDADRPALCDVEQVRHDLKLGDRLAAESRLTERGARHLLRDLLAV